MGKNMITIDTKLARAFNKAVTNVENIDEIQEDGINWNFVDADIHMDLGIPYIDTLTEYNRQFNHLADCYLGNITLADRIADSTSMNCNIDVALKLDSSKPAYKIRFMGFYTHTVSLLDVFVEKDHGNHFEWSVQ